MADCSVCNAVSFDDAQPIDELLRYVIPYAPQVPYSMALDLLRQAYTLFARKSGIIVTELVQDLQRGVKDYKISPPSGYEVHYFIGRDGCRLYSTPDSWIAYYGDQYHRYDVRFDVVDNKVIVLWDNPSNDEENGLRIYAALLPNSCVTHMPKSIITPYGWGIAQQALANLYMMPRKEWSSFGLGRRCEMEFNRTAMAARNLADANRKQGPLTAQPVRIL